MTLEEARERLKLELSKQGGHWPTVQSLFKYLHHERRAALAKMTSHSVANILETFPTLGQMKLVCLLTCNASWFHYAILH